MEWFESLFLRKLFAVVNRKLRVDFLQPISPFPNAGVTVITFTAPFSEKKEEKCWIRIYTCEHLSFVFMKNEILFYFRYNTLLKLVKIFRILYGIECYCPNKSIHRNSKLILIQIDSSIQWKIDNHFQYENTSSYGKPFFFYSMNPSEMRTKNNE